MAVLPYVCQGWPKKGLVTRCRAYYNNRRPLGAWSAHQGVSRRPILSEVSSKARISSVVKVRYVLSSSLSTVCNTALPVGLFGSGRVCLGECRLLVKWRSET
jgi:hypothetical protein